MESGFVLDMDELDAVLNLVFFVMTIFDLVDVNVLIIEGKTIYGH